MPFDVSGNLGLVNNDISEKSSELCGESKTNAASTDLPEYLEQKLRARGILKDGAAKDDLSRTENASLFSMSSCPSSLILSLF